MFEQCDQASMTHRSDDIGHALERSNRRAYSDINGQNLWFGLPECAMNRVEDKGAPGWSVKREHHSRVGVRCKLTVNHLHNGCIKF